MLRHFVLYAKSHYNRDYESFWDDILELSADHMGYGKNCAGSDTEFYRKLSVLHSMNHLDRNYFDGNAFAKCMASTAMVNQDGFSPHDTPLGIQVNMYSYKRIADDFGHLPKSVDSDFKNAVFIFMQMICGLQVKDNYGNWIVKDLGEPDFKFGETGD